MQTNSLASQAVEGDRPPGLTHQDVQAGGLQQSDLVSNAKPGKARQPLGKLHDLDDTLGGQLTELVPEPQIQLHPVVCTGVLQGKQVGMQAKACPGGLSSFCPNPKLSPLHSVALPCPQH